MGDPSSLNEWISNHGDGVLSFLTSQLVDNGLSLSPVRPTRLGSALGLCLRSNQNVIMGRVPT